MTEPDSKPRVEPRAASVVRCASCHGDLGETRYTCSGCGVTLHHDCRLERHACTTLGCAVTEGPPREQPVRVVDAKASPGPGRLLYHLTWLAPVVLTALWPLWLVAINAVTSGAGGPSSGGLLLLLVLAAMSPGFLVGHLVLAPRALARGDRGAPHLRVAVSAGLTAVLSVVVVYLVVQEMLASVDIGW